MRLFVFVMLTGRGIDKEGVTCTRLYSMVCSRTVPSRMCIYTLRLMV